MSVRLSASVFFVIKRSVKMFVVYYETCPFVTVSQLLPVMLFFAGRIYLFPYFYKSGSLGK